MYFKHLFCISQVVACWLNKDALWVFISPVAAVLSWNIAVMVKAVTVAYQSAMFRYRASHNPCPNQKKLLQLI